MSENSLGALVKAVARSKTPKCKIQTHEWNFSKCPKNQLRFCQLYEFGRSTPLLVDQVKRWRASGFKEADQPLKENDQLARLTQMDFFRLFPEFPLVPWLDLNLAEVKTRLAGLKARRPILVRSVGVKELARDGEYKDSVWVLEPYHTPTIQPMEVNWFYNDKMLISAFKAWLKENRKYRATEQRGKTTPRELLNDLAAWRLLTHHTVAEAEKITGDALGKPLFRSQSDWLDARLRAKRDLAGRLPPIPIEKLWARLDKKAFTESEVNRLWLWWVNLSESEARPLYRLKREIFTAKMRARLDKNEC